MWLRACNPVNGWYWLNTALFSSFICLDFLFYSWILHFLNAIQVLSWVLKWKPMIWLLLINSELLTAFTGEGERVEIDRLLIGVLPRVVEKFTFLWIIVMIHFDWWAFLVAFRRLSDCFCLGCGEILQLQRLLLANSQLHFLLFFTPFDIVFWICLFQWKMYPLLILILLGILLS